MQVEWKWKKVRAIDWN